MNTANPQDERFRGLLDLLIKDEQKRAAMRGKAEDFGAAAAMVQQFAVPQPMPLQNTGGLLQQPQMVQMTAPGAGIMGLQSERDEEESKLKRLMALLGIA